MPPSPYRERSPSELHPELERHRLIDVREPFELHGPLGHVAGVERIDRSALPARAESLRGEPLLVICRSGRRSAAACQSLVEHGARDVTNLAGGMIAWHAAGLPVVRRKAASLADFVDTLARWTAMLSQTPLAEVVTRWPELDAKAGAFAPPELEATLAAIEALLRDAGAPPDLDLSIEVFRADLAALAGA